MQPSEGARQSVWEATADVPEYPPLDADLDGDVCIVGAGIAGLTTAYHLLKEGRGVLVVDDGRVGGGETGRTTAHLVTAFDDYYHEVERVHGEETARRLGESFRAGVDRIEEIVRAEQIDCSFLRLDGWWFPGDDDGRVLLRRERDAAERAGFEGVDLVDEWPLGEIAHGPALRFPRQAQFHVLRYIAGLARAVERLGGVIRTGVHVTEIEDGAPCMVRTDSGRVLRANEVVVATNTPINDRVTMHTKQAPYRTYVIGMTVPRAAVSTGLYWDTLKPYHYLRLLDPNGDGPTDVLLVGGEDHKTGQAEGPEEDHFARLEQWTRARFPVVDSVYRWSGQVMEPVDYLAFIGRNPGDKHVWIATGDSGNGMTHGTIAGILLTDLIRGRESAWEAIYSPARRSVKTLPDFIRENANVAGQFADWVTAPEIEDVSEIPLGEGRILRRGARKVAAFRADDGTVTLRSAICPHLFCIVDWNSAEKTWDCPCHGSRFTPDGTVINGPAVTPLEPVEE